jgi:HEAT repeat protein
MTKITAGEQLRRLSADPGYVAAEARREAQLQQRRAASRLAQRPLLEDLRAAGYAVDDVWDLVNSAVPYASAVPVLIRHLSKPYPGRVREGIARALAVRQARSVWDELLRLYRAEGSGRTKEGLAVAIAAAAVEDAIDDVIDLVRDPELGPSRVLLLGALNRSHDPAALRTLTEVLTDPELRKEIKFILRRRRLASPVHPARG